MIRIGLTGSVGMGKSTTAKMFAVRGAGVFDADAAVHALYRGAAVGPVGEAFPEVIHDGTVDRVRLGAIVAADREALARLEAIVHPLVRLEERLASAAASEAGRPAIVLDIPLLLETGGEKRVDVVVVVTADAGIQRERVLARPGMTEERFAAILARQMPDAEKRRRSHFLVDTSFGLEAAEESVGGILRALAGPAAAHGPGKG